MKWDMGAALQFRNCKCWPCVAVKTLITILEL
jgi:hypothetical protein